MSKNRIADPSKISLLISKRNFDDPPLAWFRGLSASIGRFLASTAPKTSRPIANEKYHHRNQELNVIRLAKAIRPVEQRIR
jgi:hypothetical protein